MSIILPTAKEAQRLLTTYIIDRQIQRHCKATQQKALQIAKLISKSVKVDLLLVEVGALLHDIGRAQIHDVTHGYIGGQILQQNKYPLSIAKIVERHVLGGFTAKEASLLGLPKKSFLPQTWEEKIVCVADKLGLYEWKEIHQPQKWLTKFSARLAQFQARYEVSEPYYTSLERARQYTMTLAKLALAE